MNLSFVMLKPDALERSISEKVIQYFKKQNIEIELFGYQVCTQEQICNHYADVINRLGKDFADKACRYFVGRPVIPILLKSNDPDIIENVRKIVGSTDPSKAAKGTIRGDFGIDSFKKSEAESRCCENVIHASDSAEAVKKEAGLWFGKAIMNSYFND